jgi:predicted DNA-binding transcriptional regulator AlpA
MSDEARIALRTDFTVSELRKTPSATYLGVSSHLLPKFMANGEIVYGSGIVFALGPRKDGQRNVTGIVCDTSNGTDLDEPLELALYCRDTRSGARYAFLGRLSKSRRKLQIPNLGRQQNGKTLIRNKSSDSSQTAVGSSVQSIGKGGVSVGTSKSDISANSATPSIDGVEHVDEQNSSADIARRPRGTIVSSVVLDEVLQLLRRRAGGDDPIVRVEIAAVLTARSRSTIYRLVKQDQFPRPVLLGRAAFWKMSDLEQYRSGAWDANEQLISVSTGLQSRS